MARKHVNAGNDPNRLVAGGPRHGHRFVEPTPTSGTYAAVDQAVKANRRTARPSRRG